MEEVVLCASAVAVLVGLWALVEAAQPRRGSECESLSELTFIEESDTTLA